MNINMKVINMKGERPLETIGQVRQHAIDQFYIV